jgi:alpha-glucosidase (family GH31 glycosyl hydrolase)
MRHERARLGVALASLTACGGGQSTPPADASTHDAPASDAGASRSLSFGPGETATLTAGGELRVIQGGRTVLSTAAGIALFSSSSDAANPSGYHDPEKLAGVAFEPIASDAITMDSPAPGVLHLTAKSARKDTVLVSLALASDDGFYTGLGERYDHVDPRGQIVGMQLELALANESGTTDRHVPVPWLVSARGYGIFVKDRSIGAWDVASADPKVVRSTFEDVALDVSIVVDTDPLAVVAALAKMTGLPRKTPFWALGPMMWRHVDSQSELLGDLTMIRSLHIPTTTFWLDDGWQTGIDTFDIDPTKYDDPSGLGPTMRDMGFRWFGWSSPYLETPAEGEPSALPKLYATATKGRYFVEDASEKTFLVPGPGSGQYGLIDFTRASASKFWSGLGEKPVALGMDGFKLDYGEDMLPDILGGPLNLKLADGESERTARTYPLHYHQAYRNALAGTSDGGVLLVRASSYGGASVADIVWPGDLDNGFQIAGSTMSSGQRYVGGLPASVVAAETLAVCGFPLYGADTGGYRGGGPTKEALLRWAEHTALSMVMQLGPGEDKYPWTYDAETVSIYTTLANLHQTLTPYLYELLLEAEANGTPTIRPLPLAYPEDTEAPRFADTEYLLGPALLVAPVVTEGATSRTVHVPPGTWVSWWNGEKVVGPKTSSVKAPLGTVPLWALEGSLLPTLPDGIDTLVAATTPGTVSLQAKAGLDTAMGWVKGPAEARWPDGSTLSIDDDAKGVTLSFEPRGTGRVSTFTLDVSARARKGPPTRVVALSGGSFTKVATDAEVLAAKGNAYHLSGEQATFRIEGPAKARLE